MQHFQYQHGDQPLEGYTIERAAGRGGFGEVYYAVSDGGRQVALKAIQNYEQIELRGISQCMNLKNPHLVTIFDVKYNDQGRPFVIMEYVSGPSLRDLLEDAPGGLGAQKAAFFIREIAKGLSFLHECGIVHRDLKPGNIFYENGYVMIGDYGLSKAIQTGAHSCQTVTVGTVNYMAPEVGAGNYDRSIDIYAMGVLAYEMLTGQVPFFGASPGEVLMKHMTAQPDMSGIEEPFASAIKKALAKDPADRFSTVQEMVEAIFGSEHVRNSVSQFSPESLSMVAGRIARDLPTPTPTPAGKTPWRQDSPYYPTVEPGPMARRGPYAPPLPMARPVNRTAAARPATPVPTPAGQMVYPADPANDPMNRQQRWMLAFITMAAVSLGIGLFSKHDGGAIGLMGLLMILGASVGISFAIRKILPSLDTDGLRKLAAAAAGIVGAVVFSFITWFSTVSYIGGTVLALVVLALFNWWKLTSPGRRERVSLGNAVGIGFLGYIAASIFGGMGLLAAGVLAGTSLVMQIVSPFDPGARSSRPGQAIKDRFSHYRQSRHQRHQQMKHPAPTPHAQTPIPQPARAVHTVAIARTVPGFVRGIWAVVFVLLMGSGVAAMVEATNWRFSPACLGLSIGLLWLGLVSFIRIFRSTFNGWFRYLIRPILMSFCLGCFIGAAGEMPDSGAAFLMVTSGLGFLAAAFHTFFAPRYVKKVSPAPVYPGATVSPSSRLVALILAILFGAFGIHRFYVGKIGTGFLWLITLGLWGIGYIFDIIIIAAGEFRDKQGRRLVNWTNDQQFGPQAAPYPAAAAPQRPMQLAAQPIDTHQEPEASAPGLSTPATGSTEDTPLPAPDSAVTRTAVVYEPFHPFSWILSALGYIVLLAAFLVGLAVAVHLPALIAAGFPEPDIARELDREFGSGNWPNLMEQIGIASTAILLLIATTFIVFGRRHAGPMHLIRAVLGMLALLLSLSMLSDALPSSYPPEVYRHLENNQPGPALETLINMTREDEAIFAAVSFVIAIIILAWPPRRRKPELITQNIPTHRA